MQKTLTPEWLTSKSILHDITSVITTLWAVIYILSIPPLFLPSLMYPLDPSGFESMGRVKFDPVTMIGLGLLLCYPLRFVLSLLVIRLNKRWRPWAIVSAFAEAGLFVSMYKIAGYIGFLTWVLD